MPFWELDDSRPIITPADALAYYGRLMGDAGLRLPELLIATFQSSVLDHLATRLEIAEIHRWPTPNFFPLGRAILAGRPTSVARLPIGAAAAVSALELMIAAGVRTILVVGSAGSIQPDLPAASLLVATTAVRHEGVSHHYLPADEPAEACPELVHALLSAASSRSLEVAAGPIWTTDAPYRECAGTVAALRERGVLAVDMEASALYALASHRGVRIALITAISDELGEEWKPAFHTLSFRRSIFNAADIALAAASASA